MTQDPPIEDDGRTLPKLERPDVQVKLLELVERGHELSAAARAVNLKPETAQRWLFKGRDQRTRGVHGKYRAFLEQYEFALMKPKNEIRESVLKEAKRNGWLGLEVLARWGDPDFQPVEVEQRARELLRRIFDAIEWEFHAEPEVVARLHRAITEGRVGDTTSARRNAAPGHLEADNEAGTVAELPAENQPTLRTPDAPAPVGEGTRSD